MLMNVTVANFWKCECNYLDVMLTEKRWWIELCYRWLYNCWTNDVTGCCSTCNIMVMRLLMRCKFLVIPVTVVGCGMMSMKWSRGQFHRNTNMDILRVEGETRKRESPRRSCEYQRSCEHQRSCEWREKCDSSWTRHSEVIVTFLFLLFGSIYLSFFSNSLSLISLFQNKVLTSLSFLHWSSVSQNTIYSGKEKRRKRKREVIEMVTHWMFDRLPGKKRERKGSRFRHLVSKKVNVRSREEERSGKEKEFLPS